MKVDLTYAGLGLVAGVDEGNGQDDLLLKLSLCERIVWDAGVLAVLELGHGEELLTQLKAQCELATDGGQRGNAVQLLLLVALRLEKDLAGRLRAIVADARKRVGAGAPELPAWFEPTLQAMRVPEGLKFDVPLSECYSPNVFRPGKDDPVMVFAPEPFAGPDGITQGVVACIKTRTAGDGVVQPADARRNAETTCPETFYGTRKDANVPYPPKRGKEERAIIARWGSDPDNRGVIRLDVQLPRREHGAVLFDVVGKRGPASRPKTRAQASGARVPALTAQERQDVLVVIDEENLHLLVGDTLARAMIGHRRRER